MGKLKIGCSCLKHKVPISWTTRGCLVSKKPSLITPHSIFFTHHLKYPNFLNPTCLAHYFQLLITQIFLLFVEPTTWAPYLHIHPLFSFFFFFFHHSPPIPRHNSLFLSAPPFSSSHRVQTVPISTSPSLQDHPHEFFASPSFILLLWLYTSL